MSRPTIKKESLKDILVVVFLITPLISRWLLPSGIEVNLTKSIFYIPFYVPNILLLFFVVSAKRNKKDKNLKLIFGLHLLFSIVGILIGEYTDKIAFLFSGTYYFYAIFFALNYRITDNQKTILKRLLLFTLLILSLEVILYSTGILIYSLDITPGYDTAGIYRISTTVGGATGTAGLVFLLGCIVFYLYGRTFFGYFALILITVTVLLLISRGSIAALLLFSFLYFWNNIRKSLKSFLTTVSLLAATIVILNNIGLFDPIISRMEMLSYDNNFSTGRDVLIESSLSSLSESGNYFFGVGTGNIFPSKDIRILDIKPTYLGAPHNSYVLAYAEQGVFGFILFLIFWIVLLFSVRHNKIIFYSLLSFIVILFNTETVFLVDSEFVFLLSILIMLGLERKK